MLHLFTYYKFEKRGIEIALDETKVKEKAVLDFVTNRALSEDVIQMIHLAPFAIRKKKNQSNDFKN